MTSPTFTKKMFSPAKTPAWLEHVVPRISPIREAKWVEIGSYQGYSALWTLENVLKGPGSLIYCVDLFDPHQPYLRTFDPECPDYVKVFDANVGCLPNVVKLVGKSQDVLPILRGTRFHGAYVDADHREAPVREDVRLLWPLLLPGAVCVFDDYAWEDPGVRIVVNELLADPENNARILHKDFEAIVLKEK